MHRSSRLAVVPALDPAGGGVFQYSLAVLQALVEEPGVLVLLDRPEHRGALPGRSWTVAHLPRAQRPGTLRRLAWRTPPTIRRFVRPVRRRVALRQRLDLDAVAHRPELEAWVRERGVSFALYPEARTIAFEIRVPYAVAIHDLQHRLQPQFPEVSADGEWERREHLFRNAARHAATVLVDSETGREDVVEAYEPHGVDPNRVEVLPFVPPSYLAPPTEEGRERVRVRYGLPGRYLFYPAQFWPHKNHIRLVEAAARVPGVHLVLAGSHAGELRARTYGDVRETARRLRLDDRIHFLGFVPAGDMAALYAEAVALVFPTFFGPTNIPILEAWTLGCPVLTSDIRGIREQAGEAALLADPTSVEELADGIHRLWEDAALRERLVTGGRERVASFGPDEFRARLLEILERARLREAVALG